MNNVIDISKAKNLVHKKSKEDVVKEEPIGSNPITPEDLREDIEDAFLMGKQEAIYQTVATFLSTSEAINNHITGVRIAVENGYVNCYWEFNGGNTDGK